MALDTQQIESLLPHRSPFRFVESASVCGPDRVEGVARWNADHPVLAGHFPAFPIVPGVLIIEAAAQLAGILIAYNNSAPPNGREGARVPGSTGSPRRSLGMLVGVKRAGFHQPAFAGDRLTLTAALSTPLGTMIIASAEALNPDGERVFRGDISLALIDRSRLRERARRTDTAHDA